ncbi:MGMT family protein [Leifsonia aquatica]|uniref:MGMT family protein n=1 Tax=Leifsonia aquatica TaxID=144185 RepID=UPI0028AB25C8|nr:MGMT family protein [Leifsonia aquatica]
MPSRSDPGADSFVERVLDVVDAIPPGRVMTYGDVAAVLGSRAARMVGQIMAYYGSTVPWWRVVRASGHPPADHEQIALEHYREEGTPLLGGPRADGTATTYRVDLRAARHEPR